MKMLRLRLMDGLTAHVAPFQVETVLGRSKLGIVSPGSVIIMASGQQLQCKADPAEVVARIEAALAADNTGWDVGGDEEADAAMTGSVLAGAATSVAMAGTAAALGAPADADRPHMHHMDPDLARWMPVPLGGPDHRTPTQKRADTMADKAAAEAAREGSRES